MCKRYGVSLDVHRSSIVGADDLSWADLIVLMDRHNWAALDELGADSRKLVWLGALTQGPLEVPDPYALEDGEAERVIVRMRDATERLASKIRFARDRE